MPTRAAIFLGAFLLFAVQPLIGRAILPLFGGGAGVWLACMLFFQVVLLAGYGYTHGLMAGRSPRAGLWIHGGLLASALLCLAWPLAHGGAPWLPAPGMPGLDLRFPPLAILGVLTQVAGLPLLALSGTSPLVQSLHARAGGASPYRLYAVSNWGSMAGLVAYPLLMEPWMSLRAQAWILAGLFLAHGALMLTLFLGAAGIPETPGARAAPDLALEGPPPKGRILNWVGHSALGSLWLVAVTNKVTTDVASVPLMWVLPLGLYLLTYILAFDARWPITGRAWRLAMLGLLLVFAASLVLPQILGGFAILTQRILPGATGPILKAIFLLKPGPALGAALALLALFGGGILAHGALAEAKPGPARLTGYYLCLSIGGCLGGLLGSLFAPLVFNQTYELPMVILATSALLARNAIAGPAGRRHLVTLASASLVAALALVKLGAMATVRQDFHARDFFGTVEVNQPHPALLSLVHGTTSHGLQFIKEPLRPASYYGEGSAIGRVLRLKQREVPSLRVGVVGLGVGTVAAYGRAADAFTFIEISPKIIDLSGPGGRVFTVLRNTPAQVEVIQGDGRRALESREGAPFDVLFVDAFAGGAIPTHLLTEEALRAYLHCLKPEGFLVLHVSHHLPLPQQVGANLRDLRLPSLYLTSGPVLGRGRNGALIFVESSTQSWIACRQPGRLLAPDLLEAASAAVGVEAGADADPRVGTLLQQGEAFTQGLRPWTDARNSLTTLLLSPSR